MMVMNIEVGMSTDEKRTHGYRDYVQALEEEKKKIQVFQRELPLSLYLVSQAIESCRQRMTAGRCGSEIDEGEAASDGGPVLEFIPIKRKSSGGEDEQELGQRQEDEDSFSTTILKHDELSGNKPDWLRSVQLWSPSADPHPDQEEDTCRQTFKGDRSKGTSAFHPFLPRKASPPPAAAGEALAAASPVNSTPAASCTSDAREKKGAGDEKESHPHRKARRCWSPELHRRFLDALQQLGGSHVATPKQIRDLMKVDGLTNDEVKSHLQKFRLHSRRPASSLPHGGAANAPPQQVVFLGGLWVPPPEYAAAAAAAAAAGVVHPPPLTERMAGPHIYAPVASLPVLAQKQDPLKHPARSLTCCSGPPEERGVDGGATRSSSATTSSSSDTTSASLFNRENALQSC